MKANKTDKTLQAPEPFAIRIYKEGKLVSNQIVFLDKKERLPPRNSDQKITPLTSKAKKIYVEWLISQSKKP